MVLVMILIALMTGKGLLLLTRQHRHFNWLEQAALSLVIGVSVHAVIMLVCGWILGGFSIRSALIVWAIVMGVLAYKIVTKHIDIKDHLHAISTTNGNIAAQWKEFKPWKKVATGLVLMYCLIKIGMSFAINTHMPTFDEDAVAGWDMKTKVFAYTHSLALNKTDPEFWGSDLSRLPMAGLIDSYFLLGTDDVVGLTNIISPLVYLFSILLILGFLLRKTNLFTALLGTYVFASLPFVFIHGFASYRNFVTGYRLICIVIMLTSQDLEGFGMGWLIVPIIICLSLIRNESFMSIAIVLVLYGIYLFLERNKRVSQITRAKALALPVLALIIGFGISKAIVWTYPSDVAMNTGGIGVGAGMFQALGDSLGDAKVLKAPFVQTFHHPDYNLLFLLFTISIIGRIYIEYTDKKRVRNTNAYLTILCLVLLGLYLFAVYTNVQGLGLLTHYAFVRYPVGIILFIVLVTMINLNTLYQKLEE